VNGIIYGCLTLQAQGPPIDLSRLLPLADMKLDRSNHIVTYNQERPQSFDYVHGGLDVESAKSYVPTRGITISGYRIGVATDTNLTKKVIQSLLTINANSDIQEQTTFLDLAHSNVFLKTQGRFFISLDISGQSGKFLLMSRDMEVNLVLFCNQHNTYLLWTNEQDIKTRMQSIFGEEFYYYKVASLLNSTMVIHSHYLQNKFRKWAHVFKDSLRVFNALDSYLHRKSLGE
jgi:hypothetical protein